jgi:hypothetical protein
VHGRARLFFAAPLALLAMACLLAGPMLVSAQTAADPSNVVLVFDVSNSILLADDGTNTEFAAALEGIADRVEESAADLTLGNAEISFVVFGRTAITYPNGCARLGLHDDPAAIRKLESCLRQIAADYRAGANAPVRKRVNTVDTDHVAALREAAALLPSKTTRSAVIFFTDGQNDPPGTARDKENVVTQVRAAFQGRTPLAILPVGLGARAGAFETELRALYDAYLRDMEPCEGRAAFAWPQVIFPAADDAGIAVAQALQEVTCSFSFVPTPSETPIPSPSPTPVPVAGAPQNVQLLAGNGSITVQWTAPDIAADTITGYTVTCTPDGGGTPVSVQAGASDNQAVVSGLPPGGKYTCAVATNNPSGTSEATAAAAAIVVLGIPSAPGQPRIETLDAAARVSVDAVAGGAPAEQYDFECRDVNGNVVGAGSAQEPSAVVLGLPNGSTFDCVAYAENRIGKSPASVASARFSPCGGFFDCNPWAKWGGAGLVLVATLAALAYIARRYQRRNRVWITAQVDGGENRPLGWGPEIGIQLDRDDRGGWLASLRALEGSDIRARYRGSGRFVVQSKSNVSDVHQGDPAQVRDPEGGRHALILRRYRSKPKEKKAVPKPADAKQGSELGDRLEGKDQAKPAEPPPAKDELVG